jgi:hypothetical protein
MWTCDACVTLFLFAPRLLVAVRLPFLFTAFFPVGFRLLLLLTVFLRLRALALRLLFAFASNWELLLPRTAGTLELGFRSFLLTALLRIIILGANLRALPGALNCVFRDLFLDLRLDLDLDLDLPPRDLDLDLPLEFDRDLPLLLLLLLFL